jgi:solute carrier family 10 (sodium/bile acid cotransporter), member 7
MKNLLAFAHRHGYMLALLAAAVLGSLLPGPGARDGFLHLKEVTLLGVMLVFFLHGAGMSHEALRRGALQWRLHLFVQGTTFLVFPLVGGLVFWLCEPWLPLDLRLGFFYLCALPSTMTSSVALTAMAGGNLAAAVFNATLSGLLAMVFTPALMGLVVGLSGQQMPLLDAVLKVCATLLLPLLLGQTLHRWLEPWMRRHKKGVSLLDRGVIVLIVYASFCDSSQSGAWASYPMASMALLFALVAALLALSVWAIRLAARWRGLPRQDEVVAVFCGGQKSLANGMPMANVMLASHPGLGVIVLPMIVYHQLQLLWGSVLAQRYRAPAAK